MDVALSNVLDKCQKEELQEIDKGCRSVLYDLQRLLDENSQLSLEIVSSGKRKKIKRIWRRLKWKSEDIRDFQSRINSNVNLLTNFNGRLTRDSVAKLLRYQEELETKLLRFREDQKDQNILDWITPIDYAPEHNDSIARRQEGTGQWLLESDESQTWLGTDKHTLFCTGIPGAGKTILASIVIEHLLERRENNAANKYTNIRIAYIYCNFRRGNEQRVEGLLASLLRQLAQTQVPPPNSVIDLYRKHKDKQTQFPISELSKTLCSVISTYSRV